ncbi:MAG: ABC transporter substrate-binding protein [Desulfitobacteriaceae bacterium]
MKAQKLLSIIFGILLVGTAFTLAGCGSGTVSKSQSSGSQSGTSTLNLAVASDFKTMDAAQAGDGQTIEATQLLYTELLRLSGSFGSALIGGLAESWKWSDDGKSISFTLHKDLTFSDGTPLTTDDVAFTFTRLLDPKTKAPYQGSFTSIKGAKDFIAGKATTVTGIVVIDPQTIRFDLEKPAPYFLNLVALPSTGIVSRKAVEKYGDTFGEHPLGSGPFVLDKWNHGQELVLKKNTQYYLKGLPKIDGVDFKLGVAANLQMMMLQKGELDLVEPISSADYATVQNDPQLKKDYFSVTGPRLFYLGMNVEVAPFNNKLVRQALNYAVNKEKLVQLENGRGVVMQGVIPPWIPGYDKDVQPYPYDPEKAKQLLTQAGYPQGFEMDLLVPDYFDQPKIAAAVQSDLAKIGVKINIRQQSYPIFRQTVKEKGKVPMFVLQWATDFPDSQNVLSMLFHGSRAGQQNFTWYNNPTVNRLLDEADGTMDKNKRIDLYRQAEKIIHDDAPWIFEFYGVADGVKSPKLKPAADGFIPWGPNYYDHFEGFSKLP